MSKVRTGLILIQAGMGLTVLSWILIIPVGAFTDATFVNTAIVCGRFPSESVCTNFESQISNTQIQTNYLSPDVFMNDKFYGTRAKWVPIERIYPTKIPVNIFDKYYTSGLYYKFHQLVQECFPGVKGLQVSRFLNLLILLSSFIQILRRVNSDKSMAHLSSLVLSLPAFAYTLSSLHPINWLVIGIIGLIANLFFVPEKKSYTANCSVGSLLEKLPLFLFSFLTIASRREGIVLWLLIILAYIQKAKIKSKFKITLLSIVFLTFVIRQRRGFFGVFPHFDSFMATQKEHLKWLFGWSANAEGHSYLLNYKMSFSTWILEYAWQLATIIFILIIVVCNSYFSKILALIAPFLVTLPALFNRGKIGNIYNIQLHQYLPLFLIYLLFCFYQFEKTNKRNIMKLAILLLMILVVSTNYLFFREILSQYHSIQLKFYLEYFDVQLTQQKFSQFVILINAFGLAASFCAIMFIHFDKTSNRTAYLFHKKLRRIGLFMYSRSGGSRKKKSIWAGF